MSSSTEIAINGKGSETMGLMSTEVTGDRWNWVWNAVTWLGLMRFQL